jgi:hypothetical protein
MIFSGLRVRLRGWTLLILGDWGFLFVAAILDIAGLNFLKSNQVAASSSVSVASK